MLLTGGIKSAPTLGNLGGNLGHADAWVLRNDLSTLGLHEKLETKRTTKEVVSE